MPSKAKCKMMVGPGKKYKTMSECMSYGGKKMGKTQKPMASAKAEQDMVGTAMAKSKIVIKKNRIIKNLSRSGY